MSHGQVCESCDEPKPAEAVAARLIVCAVVLSIEAAPAGNKLKVLSLDVGGGSPVTEVTNAPNVDKVGARVVVALPGAVVRIDGEEVTVKAASVGGIKSHGMLCDAPMLGWAGGGNGTAALVPESFAPGDAHPESRPRLK